MTTDKSTRAQVTWALTLHSEFWSTPGTKHTFQHRGILTSPSEHTHQLLRMWFTGCRLCRRAPKLDDWMIGFLLIPINCIWVSTFPIILIDFHQFCVCVSLVRSSLLPQAPFFGYKWRSWIWWHVLGSVGSSRLPQAPFFIEQWLTNGFGYICEKRGIVKAHSLKGLAFTNGSGFGYSQFMIQSIMPQ